MNRGELLSGRFRIGDPAGTGGMGTVFHGHDTVTDTDVAIKVLDLEVDRERARREIAALRSLSHPGIVKYIADGETSDGRAFFAMEWLDGTTVGRHIAEVGFTLAEAVAVVREAASALAVAHAAGIVHRDIKPTNLMLVGDQVKVIDFGVVQIATAASLTRTGVTMGTPGYMAPEQARGERSLTPAVDVFALGCVLYECITGRPAFTGSMVAALMTKILFYNPGPIDQICREAPAGLVDVLDQLLAKNPSERIRSAADVVAALEGLGAMPATSRYVGQVDDTPTLPPPTSVTHCLVLSARGQPDDILEPLAEAQHAAIEMAATRWQGRCEVLATNAVVAHFSGTREAVTANAAGYADAARQILPDLITVVSDIDDDVGGIADRGVTRLSEAALSAIFARATMIT